MEQIGVPFHDQVCYRLLMHLCGAYGRPEMAIIVLKRMLNMGIIPNAITYKVYHKALIQVGVLFCACSVPLVRVRKKIQKNL